MNSILVVDDQLAIVESIKNGIQWEKLEIGQVYTACSAKDARLILGTVDVDILLTDIEMPEEDGLELFRWVKEKELAVVGIFLTSHADFTYAKEAIRLGGFDYILQPARYEEIERVLEKAVKEVAKKKRITQMEKTTGIIAQQRDRLLELMWIKRKGDREEELQELFVQLQQTFSMEYKDGECWPLFVRFVGDDMFHKKWDKSLLTLVQRNVLEELFSQEHAKVYIGAESLSLYMVLVVTERGSIDIEKWNSNIEIFKEFLNFHFDFGVSVYSDTGVFTREWKKVSWAMRRILEQKVEFTEEVEEVGEQDDNLKRIQQAEKFIKDNISKNFSRTEVAEMLHLNEDYFSRLFKKYTGYTFKDYHTMVRVEKAKKMLEYSRFSISIIASKVGCDNFSHFSKMFKKMTGYTPQEYRKEKSEKGKNIS